MKTEAQIRQHRDDLAVALKMPCDCRQRAMKHHGECRMPMPEPPSEGNR